jgi:hypothetical protein
MFRKILLVLLIGILFLTACANVLPGLQARPTPTQETPTEQPPSPDPTVESWQPAPGDEVLQREEVEIESVDLLTLESFPPQYQLHVVGWKGNPCNILRVVVNEPDEQNQIHVDVYTLLDPAATCIQVLEGFDINIPLGSYETGEYSVWLNGKQVGTITAP